MLFVSILLKDWFLLCRSGSVTCSGLPLLGGLGLHAHTLGTVGWKVVGCSGLLQGWFKSVGIRGRIGNRQKMGSIVKGQVGALNALAVVCEDEGAGHHLNI